MLLEVGRITKAHGIRGEVLVSLTGGRAERVTPGAVLLGPDGRSFVVRSASRHQGKWIVAFEGVATRTEAEALHATPLFGEPLDDPEALFVHELIGSAVVDVASGEAIGVVAAVEANPASDLLVLEGSGALIPVCFIVGREDDGRIRVELPEGLLDL